ncbi:MAG: hypothetical protein QOJ79_2249 [Actinomycetota bacterium]|jgi:uncharacterized protein (TIGR03086 family)|nr:hypothetical protein [Actinomycetota bacterium]
MTELERAVLERSAREFARTLRRVASDDWDRATPCAEWNVRQLVEHVVRGQIGYAMLLNGADGPSLIAAPDWGVGVLEPDPVNAFLRAASQLTAEFAQPGVEDKRVAHPVGVITGGELLVWRILDNIVHTWDLAVALGLDGGDLAIDVVGYALQTRPVWQSQLAQHYFAPIQPGESGDSPTELLLRLTGRDPRRPICEAAPPGHMLQALTAAANREGG